MAKKKSELKKPVSEKSTMIKIAEKVGELAGRIVNEKEHLTGMVTGAIKSVKATLHDITAGEKIVAKKSGKAIVKKLDKKIARPATRKIKKAAASKKPSPVKKTIKKRVKKAAKKASPKK